MKELHATLNGDEFLMWLINFRVVPQLMTRNEAMDIFNEVEEAGQIGLVVIHPTSIEPHGAHMKTRYVVLTLSVNSISDVASIPKPRSLNPI